MEFHMTYSLGKCIGKGSWGRVYAVRLRAATRGCCEQQRAAVKIIQLHPDHRTTDRRQVREEARLWSRVGSHPHCVELYGVYADRQLTYMVMERCEASLVHRLTHIQDLSEREIARIFREMVLAIQHLHGLRIVHRDFKTDNLLFDAAGSVKLCDFGFAALMPWRGRRLYGCYGTPPYMSPEMVRGEGHALNTDVWSLGATAYVLLYGDFPYMPAILSSETMKVAISTGYPNPRYERSNVEVGGPSESATAFVKSLLVRNPARRPHAAEALQHPFLQPMPATPAATCREPSLVPVIDQARIATERFKAQAAKCIVDRTLDELLQRLQRQSSLIDAGTGLVMCRFFSDSIAVDEVLEAPPGDGDFCLALDADMPACVPQPKQQPHRRGSIESDGSDMTFGSSRSLPSFATRSFELQALRAVAAA